MRLHKLVFEEGGLADGTELYYYHRGQVVSVNEHKQNFVLTAHNIQLHLEVPEMVMNLMIALKHALKQPYIL